jgi:hypothetical protein
MGLKAFLIKGFLDIIIMDPAPKITKKPVRSGGNIDKAEFLKKFPDVIDPFV